MKKISKLLKKIKLVFILSFNDFKTEYAGMGLGLIWMFVKPIIMILTYWVVHTKVFKTPDINGTPFIIWLILGVIPWLFLSDSTLTSSYSIRIKSYLIKKMYFDSKLLPIIQILKSIYNFLLLMVCVVIVNLLFGVNFHLYNLQFFYYLFASFCFLTAFSKLYSPLIVMSPDMGQLLNVIMQLLFWITPIMWLPGMLKGTNIEFLFKLNPFFYLVEGFRDSFITGNLFYNNLNDFKNFWLITIIIYILGTIVFKKLSKDFDDVL